MNPQVTIAIPLFNAEKYIEETMNCALSQSFQDIEFLIIDDKGTDRSVELIRHFEKTHSRGQQIRIISHESNQGVAAARNTALHEATGDFLFFLDSDDFIVPDCIKLLYNTAIKTQAEVVYASYREVWEKDKEKYKDFELPEKTFNGEDQLAQFANLNLRQTLRSFVWNALYDLKFLRATGIQFHHVKIWEDLLFFYDLTPLIKKAIFLKDITYFYIKREGSLSQYQSRNTIPLEEIMEHLRIREYCKNKCKELVGKPYFDNLITKTMKICIDTAAVAIEKRRMFVPPIPQSEIKKILRHPLPLTTICQMKSYRTFNILAFLLGKLPEWMIITILDVYFKLLKTYRNYR